MEKSFKLALVYNLLVYIQIFALVGGTSPDEFPPTKGNVYIHKYLYNKILVS